MTIGGNSLTARLLVLVAVTILHRVSLNSVSASCEFSIVDHKKLYNYSLASPSSKFPHGVLSEDGFYKVAGNGTVLWFQLCDGMIFNHDRPTCLDCTDCGGPSRCGMGCSALVANSIGGYHVCRTVGFATSMSINLIDTRRPHMGVVVVMSNRSPVYNCSISVSVLCDLDGVQGPQTLEKVGICGYATQLRHPSGCARIVSAHGNGWGWFGGIMTLTLCLFGGYLLAGTVYRFFYLGIHGIDIIPNLEFWASLPHRVKSLSLSLIRRFRGPSEGYRASYSPVNF